MILLRFCGVPKFKAKNTDVATTFESTLLQARGQEGKDEKAEGLVRAKRVYLKITHKRDGKKRQQKEARAKDADIEGDTGLTAAALAATNELLATAKELYRSLGGGSEDEGGDAAGDDGDDDDDSEYWRRVRTDPSFAARVREAAAALAPSSVDRAYKMVDEKISVGLEYTHESTSLFHSFSHSSWLTKHVVRPYPPTPGTSLTMSGHALHTCRKWDRFSE
ncbi:hypothetical protein B0H14DRAFT_3151290 [Mycena olivaceomarginata]|nr:hypothetical protein B0H14DRAFT_3151290 [Mycena olivaceomarginata]